MENNKENLKNSMAAKEKGKIDCVIRIRREQGKS